MINSIPTTKGSQPAYIIIYSSESPLTIENNVECTYKCYRWWEVEKLNDMKNTSKTKYKIKREYQSIVTTVYHEEVLLAGISEPQEKQGYN